MAQNERVDHHRGAVVARICSWLVITLAAVAVAGWRFDLPMLQSFIPGRIEMKLVTAMAFTIAAAALLAALAHPPRERLRTALAVLVALLGLLSVGEYVTGKNLLFWMWDANGMGAAETLQPGRMAPNTAASLVFIGLTLALLRARSRPARAAVNGALLVVSLLVLEVLIGYAYGASDFRGPAAFNPMTLPAAICFILMVAGIAALRRHQWPLSLLSGDFPGVSLTRLLLAGAVAMPFMVGWLALLGQRANMYDFVHGVAFFTMTQIVLIGSLIVWSTSRLRAAKVVRQHSDARVRRTITVQERIAGAAASTDDAVSAIVAGATEIAGAGGAAVALVRESDLLILGASGIASGLAGQVLAAEEVLAQEFLRMTGAESIVTIPLRCSTQKQCVLAVISARRDAFSDEDSTLLQLIAPASSSALRHAGQFDALEARYRGLLEAAPDAMVVVNQTGDIVLLNLQAEKVFGYRRDELLGQNVRNIIPEGFAERLIAGGDGSAEDPMIQQMGTGLELRGRRKDGSEFPIEIMLSPLESTEGMQVTAAIRDITVRKTAEQHFVQSQAHLAEAQQIAQLGSWSYNARDGKLEWPLQTFEIFGISRPEFDGTLFSYLELIHPEDRANVASMLVAPLPAPAYEFMYRTFRKDSTVRVIDCKVRLAAGTLEEPLKLVGTIQDVTDRENAEGTIWKLSRQNELLLTHAAQGIFGLDRSGKVTFANPAVSKISGWSREELLAAPSVHDILHGRKPDGASYPPGECPMNQTLDDGIVRSGSELFFRKTGESFPVEFSCSPIYEESEIAGCVTIFGDVSERLQLEQKVEQSLRIDTLGHVAATIAHEFNNVLMGIQPFAELIRQRANGDKTLATAASQIISSVTRGKRVTQEILQFTQPAEPTVQVVDMEEWLGTLLPELRAMIGHRIHLALEVPRERVMIRCDAPQLQQVLTNLVLNARDAMSKGGKITISVSTDRGQAPAGMALVSVADTGSGMTRKVLENIFEPLFTTKRSGTGLGLAVAQQVVTRNGGSIHAESAPGVGTTFHIAIPLAEASQCPTEVPAQRASLRVRRVLLVEDEPSVVAGVMALLELEGIEVAVAERGAQAVPAADSFRPEAVILDLSLPDMPGTEVYERLAARWPNLPVIFSTGHGDETVLKPYLSGPHVGFLRKPYDFAALTAMLQKVSESVVGGGVKVS